MSAEKKGLDEPKFTRVWIPGVGEEILTEQEARKRFPEFFIETPPCDYKDDSQFSKEYLKFAEWAFKEHKKAYTRQQVEWAEFFLKNPIVAKIGDILTVLVDVREYLRK